MARIRSVHPGLWTDEDFVQLSMAARLFLIGMWNEADDYGLFEWKPTRLKMRLSPNDTIDAAALMDELVAARFLSRIDRAGRALGLVRNFRKWQRPKTPSAPIVPVDAEIISAIGIDKPDEIPQHHRSTSEALPQSLPKPPENPALMEDGGGGMKEGDSVADATGAAAPPAAKSLGDLIWQHGPRYLGEHGIPERQARSVLGKWRKERGDAETLTALISAERECVSEPVAWIEGRFKNGGTKRKSGAGAAAERWDSILAGGLESIGYLCGDDGIWRGPDGETLHDPGGAGLPS